jgi:hypothetical protein
MSELDTQSLMGELDTQSLMSEIDTQSYMPGGNNRKKQSLRDAELRALEAEVFGADAGSSRVSSKNYLGVYASGDLLPKEILDECVKNGLSEDDFRIFMETYCKDTTAENSNYWKLGGMKTFEQFISNVMIEDETHIWIDGLIYPGSSADINLSEFEKVLSKIGARRNFSVHLLGHGTTPDFVHPKWIVKYGGNVPANFLAYRGGQRRVDITLHFDAHGRKILYGMKFTPSNFIEYREIVHLGNDLGMRIAGDKMLFNTQINATEKLIQLPKNIASTMPKYGDEQYSEDNMSNLEQAISELSPKIQKKLGRAARLSKDGAGLYFQMANGSNIDVFNPNWSGVGTNVLIQAFGAMLRLFRGDSALFLFLEFCKKHEITVLEAAVHSEIEQGKTKLSFGGDPDVTWGGSLTYPWMSRSHPYMTKGLNHLGLGYKLVMLAMTNRADQTYIDARKALGFPNGAPILLEDGSHNLKEMCRLAGTLVFERILQ